MADRGRPKEYRPEMVEQGYEWLETCRDYRDAQGYLQVKIPTIEGLAICLKISRDTVYAWAIEYKDFSDMVELLKARQAERLLHNGLSGQYNASITKLMLNKHNYHDKQEIDHTTAGDKITTSPIVQVYNTAPPIAESEETIEGPKTAE